MRNKEQAKNNVILKRITDKRTKVTTGFEIGEILQTWKKSAPSTRKGLIDLCDRETENIPYYIDLLDYFGFDVTTKV